jgi:hypothetical protein
VRVRVAIVREPGDSADEIIDLFRMIVRVVSKVTSGVTVTLTDDREAS